MKQEFKDLYIEEHIRNVIKLVSIIKRKLSINDVIEIAVKETFEAVKEHYKSVLQHYIPKDDVEIKLLKMCCCKYNHNPKMICHYCLAKKELIKC